MVSIGLWLLLWVGIFSIYVECRHNSLTKTTTAAILPGLNFFNKKEDDSQRQKQDGRQQQQRPPPFPPPPHAQHGGTMGPRHGGQQQQQQLPPRPRQFSPMMERPPLPPPPRQAKQLEEGRRPLPPKDESHPRKDGDEVEELDDTEMAVAPPLQENQPETPRTTGTEHSREEEDETMVGIPETQEQVVEHQQEPLPPPIWSGGPYGGPFAGMPPPPGSWGGPPVDGTWGQPPPYDQTTDEQWRIHQQQQPPQQFYPPAQDDYANNDVVKQLRQDLDDSLAREHDLLQEMQNLTQAFGSLQSQEESHLQRVDMLTERVMDAEARAASERNAALEYRANCTELGQALTLARDELDEWKEQCQTLKESKEETEEKLGETTKDLKSRSLELEELALVVENLRLRDEHDTYVAERKKKKSGGFFAWLFGGFAKGYDQEEEQLEDAQELARSTLLRALQTERNNVHELEAVVSTLQQNNSAISEVVESRDSLINELNDRVAVFEEDKLVLKAALRQLQKEIKEEAPKTQKLVNDLKNAKEETKQLKAEIDELISSHRAEITDLQQAISLKQTAINDRESNLTVIGTYVDKLEERLGDFAMARRDIEIREEKCKKIEEMAIQTGNERDKLTEKVAELTTEQEEFKSLLEELASERTKVQKEMSGLQKERDNLLIEEKRLLDSIGSMEADVQQLGEVLDEWKTKVWDLEAEVEELRSLKEEVKEVEDDVLAVVEVEKSILVNEEVPQNETATDDSPAEMNEVKELGPGLNIGSTEPSIPRGPDGWESSDEDNEEDNSQDVGEESDFKETPAPTGTEESEETDMTETSPPKPPPESVPPRLQGAPRGETLPKPQPPFPPGSNFPPPMRRPRDVRFRKIRKAFSKRTGIHGFFTPASSIRRPPPSYIRPTPPKEKRRLLPLLGRKRPGRQEQK